MSNPGEIRRAATALARRPASNWTSNAHTCSGLHARVAAFRNLGHATFPYV